MSAARGDDLPAAVRAACRLLIEDPASGYCGRDGLTPAGEALLRDQADQPGIVRLLNGEARLSAEAAVARARRLLAERPDLLTPTRRALQTVTQWTGSYRDGRTGRAMGRAEARRTCRAAMRAGLDAVALVDGDVLIVRVLDSAKRGPRP